MTGKPRVVIVDDERPARERLRDLVESDGRLEIAGEAGNGLEAIEVLERTEPDLLLLDIQMPELDGFEVLEHLSLDPLPAVIFITAFDEYAVKAFEVEALDYLLKPVNQSRFATALDRALSRVEGQPPEEATRRIRKVMAGLPSERQRLTRFLVRRQERLFLVPVDEVEWIAAAGNYVEIHSGRETHLVRGTLNGLEARLDPSSFVRVHRSTIVNLNEIEELQDWSHGDYQIVMRDGTRLRMSRRYRDALGGAYGP